MQRMVYSLSGLPQPHASPRRPIPQDISQPGTWIVWNNMWPKCCCNWVSLYTFDWSHKKITIAGLGSASCWGLCVQCATYIAKFLATLHASKGRLQRLRARCNKGKPFFEPFAVLNPNMLGISMLSMRLWLCAPRTCTVDAANNGIKP